MLAGLNCLTTYSSVISLLEVLVGPFKHGLRDLAHVYREIFDKSEGLTVQGIDNDIAVTGARLRARYNLAASDALQAATALKMGVDYFLTNDKKLKRLEEELCVLVLEELEV